MDRSLADSKVEAISTDLRFIAAFNAALCVATTALRASGHRTVTQAGHHVKTIESLELTIKASPKIIQRFKTFNNKRNKSVYDNCWRRVRPGIASGGKARKRTERRHYSVAAEVLSRAINRLTLAVLIRWRNCQEKTNYVYVLGVSDDGTHAGPLGVLVDADVMAQESDYLLKHPYQRVSLTNGGSRRPIRG